MSLKTRIKPVRDGAFVHFFRDGKLETKLRLGPNHVHAFITHPDGEMVDLGISKNLLTNGGRDLWANAFGHLANASGVATATTATSMTGTGFTANQYMGWRVFMPITAITTPPVYGNVISNTTTVLTLDQWWNAADNAASTPAGTNAYYLIPTCIPRFMALDMTATAPAAADNYLQAEITTGGCARAKSTFAHTAGTATYTQQTVYNVTASFTAIYKMGLFTSLNPSATVAAQIGIMVFETALNTTATVNSGDTLTVTDTITLSG